MENYRFFILLFGISTLLLLSPFATYFGGTENPLPTRVAISGLVVAMLLSAVLAVARTPWTVITAAVLGVPAVFSKVLSFLFDTQFAEVASHLLTAAFLGFVILVILRFLFEADRVRANTICAAVCVYLLMGVFGALLMSIVEGVAPDSFVGSRTLEKEIVHFGDQRSATALYFSFVTLTTLGYGDITPVSPLAKMLVVLEAVTGQLFLTVLLARLVGLHISYSANKRADQPAEKPAG